MRDFISIIVLFIFGSVMGVIIALSIDKIKTTGVREYVNNNSLYILDTLYNKDLTIDTIIVYKK